MASEPRSVYYPTADQSWTIRRPSAPNPPSPAYHQEDPRMRRPSPPSYALLPNEPRRRRSEPASSFYPPFRGPPPSRAFENGVRDNPSISPSRRSSTDSRGRNYPPCPPAPGSVGEKRARDGEPHDRQRAREYERWREHERERSRQPRAGRGRDVRDWDAERDRRREEETERGIRERTKLFEEEALETERRREAEKERANRKELGGDLEMQITIQNDQARMRREEGEVLEEEYAGPGLRTGGQEVIEVMDDEEERVDRVREPPGGYDQSILGYPVMGTAVREETRGRAIQAQSRPEEEERGWLSPEESGESDLRPPPFCSPSKLASDMRTVRVSPPRVMSSSRSSSGHTPSRDPSRLKRHSPPRFDAPGLTSSGQHRNDPSSLTLRDTQERFASDSRSPPEKETRRPASSPPRQTPPRPSTSTSVSTRRPPPSELSPLKPRAPSTKSTLTDGRALADKVRPGDRTASAPLAAVPSATTASRLRNPPAAVSPTPILEIDRPMQSSANPSHQVAPIDSSLAPAPSTIPPSATPQAPPPRHIPSTSSPAPPTSQQTRPPTTATAQTLHTASQAITYGSRDPGLAQATIPPTSKGITTPQVLTQTSSHPVQTLPLTTPTTAIDGPGIHPATPPPPQSVPPTAVNGSTRPSATPSAPTIPLSSASAMAPSSIQRSTPISSQTPPRPSRPPAQLSTPPAASSLPSSSSHLTPPRTVLAPTPQVLAPTPQAPHVPQQHTQPNILTPFAPPTSTQPIQLSNPQRSSQQIPVQISRTTSPSERPVVPTASAQASLSAVLTPQSTTRLHTTPKPASTSAQPPRPHTSTAAHIIPTTPTSSPLPSSTSLANSASPRPTQPNLAIASTTPIQAPRPSVHPPVPSSTQIDPMPASTTALPSPLTTASVPAQAIRPPSQSLQTIPSTIPSSPHKHTPPSYTPPPRSSSNLLPSQSLPPRPPLTPSPVPTASNKRPPSSSPSPSPQKRTRSSAADANPQATTTSTTIQLDRTWKINLSNLASAVTPADPATGEWEVERAMVEAVRPVPFLWEGGGHQMTGIGWAESRREGRAREWFGMVRGVVGEDVGKAMRFVVWDGLGRRRGGWVCRALVSEGGELGQHGTSLDEPGKGTRLGQSVTPTLPASASSTSTNHPKQGQGSDISHLPHSTSTSQSPLDAQAVLCPFELHGTCNDHACPFQHLSKHPSNPSTSAPKPTPQPTAAPSAPSAPIATSLPPAATSIWKPIPSIPSYHLPIITGKPCRRPALSSDTSTTPTAIPPTGAQTSPLQPTSTVSSSSPHEIPNGVIGDTSSGLSRKEGEETGQGEDEPRWLEDYVPLDGEEGRGSGGGAEARAGEVRYFVGEGGRRKNVEELELAIERRPHDPEAWLALAVRKLVTGSESGRGTAEKEVEGGDTEGRERETDAVDAAALVVFLRTLDEGRKAQGKGPKRQLVLPEEGAIRPALRVIARSLDSLPLLETYWLFYLLLFTLMPTRGPKR